ncbi:MAG: dockerin type I domain-containing protein, partial [Pirellula sp.]
MKRSKSCRKAISRKMFVESLESRSVMAGDFFHNFVLPEDADASGSVTPLDALVVINRINQSVEGNPTDADPTSRSGMLDVDADSEVTPLDALVVIDSLNSRLVSGPRASRVNVQRRIERIEQAIATNDLPPSMTLDDAHSTLETLRKGGQPELGDHVIDGVLRRKQDEIPSPSDASPLIDDVIIEDGIEQDELEGPEGFEEALEGGAGNGMEVDTDTTDTNDILYEVPGNPRAYADDASEFATPIIVAVDGQVRNFLRISAADSGLRVRVQINDGTVTQPGRWGDRVTGVWRYLTPDKIQVWGKWSYPVSEPSQVSLAVQWRYDGPLLHPERISSGGFSDYTNPANYSISQESRLYAGYLNGPASFLVNWLPGSPANFLYHAPSEEALAYWFPGTVPASGTSPFEAVKVALRSLPNFTDNR